MKFSITNTRLADDILARLDPVEAATVAELTERDDTSALLVMDGQKLVGYAVFGLDLHDMVTVYAARSINHLLTRCAMQAFFGVAQVLGTQVRVHTTKLRAMAHMMGAGEAFAAAMDSDGIPMGVFGVQ